MASLVLTDSSQLTSDSQHLGIYSNPVASLVLTDSSQLTSNSQHLGIYSSPVASLVLTDSSQLTSDSQHLVPVSTKCPVVRGKLYHYSITSASSDFPAFLERACLLDWSRGSEQKAHEPWPARILTRILSGLKAEVSGLPNPCSNNLYKETHVPLPK
uniref:Uncharacterized protein n=1 Tax=Timema douglasi TaxID=61478 RepID=A0A7R8VW54_TIMDO|nr:unnamed protein product [Timema douglasi]